MAFAFMTMVLYIYYILDISAQCAVHGDGAWCMLYKIKTKTKKKKKKTQYNKNYDSNRKVIPIQTRTLIITSNKLYLYHGQSNKLYLYHDSPYTYKAIFQVIRINYKQAWN